MNIYIYARIYINMQIFQYMYGGFISQGTATMQYGAGNGERIWEHQNRGCCACSGSSHVQIMDVVCAQEMLTSK